jgi:drug/metabolite transporter (DMT)-like permease
MASLLMPFAASLIYVFAALFLKEASSRGAGLWRTAAITNVICAVLFAALWSLGGRVPEPSAWIQPAIVGGLFVAGQMLGFFALAYGDVSVATPVMGIKVVLVALFVTAIIGERVPAVVWIAAALSSAGILLLSRGGAKGSAGGRTGPSILFGGLAAVTFALFDVLVQKWSPAWGAGRFLPVMMAFVALFSSAQLILSYRRKETVPRGAWRPLLLGGFFIAVQGLLLILALALYSKATRTNVIYSARGLWSVAAVWWIGHWFGNVERDGGSAVLRARLAGAALLLAAIVLVVVAR